MTTTRRRRKRTRRMKRRTTRGMRRRTTMIMTTSRRRRMTTKIARRRTRITMRRRTGRNFLDLDEIFWICGQFFLDLWTIFFGFVDKIVMDLLMKCFGPKEAQRAAD